MPATRFNELARTRLSTVSRRTALWTALAGLAAGVASSPGRFVTAQDASPEAREETRMTSSAFIIPILPGMVERDREFGAEVTGPRRAEYEASRARLGITREQVWQQETPEGTVTIVYLEADDVEQALAGIGSSQEPFDVWWREQIVEIHGIDPAQPVAGPPNLQIIDFIAG